MVIEAAGSSLVEINERDFQMSESRTLEAGHSLSKVPSNFPCCICSFQFQFSSYISLASLTFVV